MVFLPRFLPATVTPVALGDIFSAFLASFDKDIQSKFNKEINSLIGKKYCYTFESFKLVVRYCDMVPNILS